MGREFGKYKRRWDNVAVNKYTDSTNSVLFCKRCPSNMISIIDPKLNNTFCTNEYEPP